MLELYFNIFLYGLKQSIIALSPHLYPVAVEVPSELKNIMKSRVWKKVEKIVVGHIVTAQFQPNTKLVWPHNLVETTPQPADFRYATLFWPN